MRCCGRSAFTLIRNTDESRPSIETHQSLRLASGRSPRRDPKLRTDDLALATAGVYRGTTNPLFMRNNVRMWAPAPS